MLLRAGDAIAEVPQPRVERSIRRGGLIGEGDRQRPVAAQRAAGELRRRRCVDGDDLRAAVGFQAGGRRQCDGVQANSRILVRRILERAGDAVAELPQ
jgi:hypothetical protein